MTAVPVIIDTDFSADVGDLGALATACGLARMGRFEILGVTCGTSKDKAPGAIDAVCTYFDLDPYPAISTWKGAAFDPGVGPSETWAGYCYDNFSHPNGGLASTWPDGTASMRQILAARTSADVVLIALGPLNAIAALLNSTADGYSALSGSALVAASVKTLYVMGGKYPNTGTAEWNFEQDPASANDVCANWPTPIVFTPFEIAGSILGGATLAANKPVGNILRATYNNSGYTTGRTAWDEMCVMAVAMRNAGFAVTRGSMVANASTGVSTFTPSATGAHSVLTKVDSDAEFQSRINLIMEADPTASPVLASFASTAQWLTMGT